VCDSKECSLRLIFRMSQSAMVWRQRREHRSAGVEAKEQVALT